MPTTDLMKRELMLKSACWERSDDCDVDEYHEDEYDVVEYHDGQFHEGDVDKGDDVDDQVGEDDAQICLPKKR